MHEGGIRVPFFAVWPEKIQKNQLSFQVGHRQSDIYPRLQRHYKKPEPYATNVAYKGPWKLLLDSITPVELNVFERIEMPSWKV